MKLLWGLQTETHVPERCGGDEKSVGAAELRVPLLARGERATRGPRSLSTFRRTLAVSSSRTCRSMRTRGNSADNTIVETEDHIHSLAFACCPDDLGDVTACNFAAPITSGTCGLHLEVALELGPGPHKVAQL